jgi:4-amino-4-deoxy-L-arabinose transferase-like glycosyltransferase
MIRKNTVLFALTSALFMLVISFSQWTDGMFMDGLYYATVARNMAEGVGTFWKPSMSPGMFIEFTGHPPLAYWLQSIWFRIFGDSIYVERFYSFFTFVFSGAFITLSWKEITRSFRNAWIPVFLWISLPIVIWASPNNLLENTMTVFVTAAAWTYLKSRAAENRPGRKYLFIIFTGFFLTLAWLTKGFTSLYILTMPVIDWLIYRKERFGTMVFRLLILLFATAVPLLIIFLLSAEAKQFFVDYLNDQVFHRIAVADTAGTHFDIIVEFLQNIVVPVLFWLIFVIVVRRNNQEALKHSFSKFKKESLFFTLLTLSGILPIMISSTQRGFYILTVYPFFAISIALLVASCVEAQVKKLTMKGLRVLGIISVSMLAAAITLSAARAGTVGRDRKLIEDSRAIVNTVGKNEVIGIPGELLSDWSLHGYLARYGNVGMIVAGADKYPYYLTRQGNDGFECLEPIDIPLNRYTLFRRVPVGH